MNFETSIWVEKYRPKKLEELHLPDDMKNFFKRCVENRDIPNLLLFGNPGGGKCLDGDEYIDIWIEQQLTETRIKFKNFFDLFSTDINSSNEINKLKRKAYVKTPDGELQEIIGVIKKTDNKKIKLNFDNEISIKCAEKHLIKTNKGFKFAKDLTKKDDVLVFNSSPIKLKNKRYCGVGDVYDIMLGPETKHEYITPNGLVHHNTACAQILTSANGILSNPKDNLLFVNGSSKEGKSITFVQDVIEPFMKVPPDGNDKCKVVFIDEGDYLTDASFHSLRGTIERFSSKYGRIILTCNYLSKIPDALQSRMQLHYFKQIPINYLLIYCKNILQKENIDYDERDIVYIIESLYPDVRKIINKIQQNCSDGQRLVLNKESLITDENTVQSLICEIIDLLSRNEKNSKIIDKNIRSLIPILSKPDIDYRSLYVNLFARENFPAHVKVVINKYSNSHGACLVPSMHFMALVFDIIKIMGEYNNLVNGKK